MSKSIMQDEKESYISLSTRNLQRHHIFFGTANRRLSEKYGCWVWLTQEEHTGKLGVHNDRSLDLYLKRKCQKRFEEIHGHEKFMTIFGRNYL